MILNIENTSGAGKPVRVFDANGNEVAFLVSANTETGEVERYKLDSSGELVFHPECGGIELETIFLAKPLRFEVMVT